MPYDLFVLRNELEFLVSFYFLWLHKIINNEFYKCSSQNIRVRKYLRFCHKINEMLKVFFFLGWKSLFNFENLLTSLVIY